MARTRNGRDPSSDDRALTATRDTLVAVFREEAGRLAASVTRILGDFDAAEEVVQDALLAAWQQWPADGLPDRPGAWLSTVARRRAIDVLRRDVRYRVRASALGFPVEQADEDDRLMLIFTCCHPALSQEAQVALTLRTVCGLSTAEIASAFLVSETAIIQRLTRARLIRLHRARALARFDSDGRLMLLRDQDRSRWNRTEIAAAADLVVRTAQLRRPGPYQIQAAIVACHAEAPTWAETDWMQILLLYDALLCHQPSAVIRLHRAVVIGHVFGAPAALKEVDALAGDLGRYHLYHATRAELLRDLGRPAEARLADELALCLTTNPAERTLLEQRLT
jgi:RNA polymerase sigma factor (sigma-70 family)